jgi:hypothetical protein
LTLLGGGRYLDTVECNTLKGLMLPYSRRIFKKSQLYFKLYLGADALSHICVRIDVGWKCLGSNWTFVLTVTCKIEKVYSGHIMLLGW